MADITVSLPDATKDWIEDQVRSGRFANAGEFVSELVMRERIHQGEELSLDEMRQLVTASRESGTSPRSVEEIFAEAEKVVARRKAKRV
ncbi:antitoxin ParD1/3/4 [Neorhizobium sp. 2083]|uniref:ribbon-helix-helix domain-containing protein n=1 Tax=Neorhizobium sp. 2083 TaxID=2817762 RepID=UPI00285DF4E9|nr:type II toxin-antitoxin system ParD family antitoxin [Neorhizobium sp. 2083]MDR6817104.1 antitoxin ParD1/3/4 [Neorhizobium sp. 2083]